jgi:hypothetical protein
MHTGINVPTLVIKRQSGFMDRLHLVPSVASQYVL